MRILVAEADAAAASLIEKTLAQGGHSAVIVRDGGEALQAMGREPFDALLTGWALPGLDGADLIRRARATARPAPLIMILTSPQSSEAREKAIDSGADDFLARPFSPRELLGLLSNALARRRQPAPERSIPPPRPVVVRPPYVGVALAASTGGPDAISRTLRALPEGTRAAFFAVLHGPVWMMETFVQRLRGRIPMKISLAEEGLRAAPGEILVAPGDRHLSVEPGTFAIRLTGDPLENYVRPSADPLFRSLARAFGRHSLAVVLTGMGRDGSAGADHVAAAGGVVIAQDPSTTVAPSMPQTVINMGIAADVLPLEGIPAAILRRIEALSEGLSRI